jgi:hypothetical protein
MAAGTRSGADHSVVRFFFQTQISKGTRLDSSIDIFYCLVEPEYTVRTPEAQAPPVNAFSFLTQNKGGFTFVVFIFWRSGQAVSLLLFHLS